MLIDADGPRRLPDALTSPAAIETGQDRLHTGTDIAGGAACRPRDASSSIGSWYLGDDAFRADDRRPLGPRGPGRWKASPDEMRMADATDTRTRGNGGNIFHFVPTTPWTSLTARGRSQRRVYARRSTNACVKSA